MYFNQHRKQFDACKGNLCTQALNIFTSKPPEKKEAFNVLLTHSDRNNLWMIARCQTLADTTGLVVILKLAEVNICHGSEIVTWELTTLLHNESSQTSMFGYLV